MDAMRRPSRGGRRIATGLLLAAVGFGLALWAPGFTLLAAAIAVACLYEFAQLSARNGSELEFPVALAAVVAYFGLTYAGLIHRYEGILLAATVVAALGTATLRKAGGAFARSAYTLLGVLYIGKLTTYFVAIRLLPGIGLAATFYVIVLIAFTDIFAMVVGTIIGRTPLTPISPRKTVEGSIGGLAATVAAGIVMGMLLPALALTWWQGAVVGIITSIAAQCGDLVESAFKRDAHVKDAGTLIVGHGGVLDRFDSYLFGGVAFYFALYILGVIPRALYGP